MFKKLKEKITEEVKSSPQRFAEFTQTVSDRLQNNTTTDENFFSIGDDDNNASANSSNHGFSSVALVSPTQDTRLRRNSNTSVASDISFLPRYESSNMYQLQSDLDISASEMEDNVSTTSSQLGHLSKEQIYSAFQKSQLRYHKYRGRYTDLARHYKDLERENAKMKSVLVDTQDKAIRRVTELKEQCSLEQNAKAHLESALRNDIDEKNYKIKTLQTKIELLQNENKSDSLVYIEENGSQSEKLENLTKYLTDARKEIETLNERNQEMKANFIVFQSKEQEYKMKIATLEKEITIFSEREKENNLNLAQNKMELHHEILNKDAEITALKRDNEVLKQNLVAIETEIRNNGSTKLENLQIQNKKLIEKLETVTQRSNYLENELLKMESHKLEIEDLKQKQTNSITEISDLQRANNILTTEKENLLADVRKYEEKIQILSDENLKLEENLLKERKELEIQILSLREDAKKGLLSLEPKIREKLQIQYSEKENELKREFSNKIKELSFDNNNIKEVKLQLLLKDDVIKEITEALDMSRNELAKKIDEYNSLEKNHLELINECTDLRNAISNLEKDKISVESYEEKILRLELHINTLQEEVKKFEEIFQRKEAEIVYLSKENFNLQQIIKDTAEQNKVQEEKYQAIDLECTEYKLLELKVQKLEEEKNTLLIEFDNERQSYNQMLEKHKELVEKEEDIAILRGTLKECSDEIAYLRQKLTEEKEKNINLEENKLHFENQIKKLEKTIRIFEEKDEALNMDKTECALLELKLQKLEEQNRVTLESFESERQCFAKELNKIKQSLSETEECQQNDMENGKNLQQIIIDINHFNNIKKEEIVYLSKENTTLQQELNKMHEQLRLLEEKNETTDLEKNESKLLLLKIQKLEEENQKLLTEFEMERTMFEGLLENHKEVQEKETIIEQLDRKLNEMHKEVSKVKDNLSKKELENIHLAEEKLILERSITKLEEKIKIFNEKDEAINMDKTECSILEIKLQQLEEERKNMLDSFELERVEFNKIYEKKSKNEELMKQMVEENLLLKGKIENLDKMLKEKAEEFENVQVERTKKIDFLNSNIQNLEMEIEKTKFKLKDTVEENVLNIEKMQQLTVSNDNLNEALEKKDRQVLDLSEKITNLTIVIQKQTEEFNHLLERTKLLDENMEKIKNESSDTIKNERGRQIVLTAKIEELQNELDKKTNEFSQMGEKFANLEKLYSDDQNNHQIKSNETELLQSKIVELQESINTYQKLKEEKQCVDDELERLKTIKQDKNALANKLKQIEVHIREKNTEIEITKQENNVLKEEKDDLLGEITSLRSKIDHLNSEINNLRTLSSQAANNDKKSYHLQIENESLKAQSEALNKEISELNIRIHQINLDNQNIMDESQSLIAEKENLKLKLEYLESEKLSYEELKDRLNNDNMAFTSEKVSQQLNAVQSQNIEFSKENNLSNSNNTDLSKIQQDFYELKGKCDSLFAENKNLKMEYTKLEEKCNDFSKIKQKLEDQVSKLENLYTEILNEKQLLQDEVQELKISPVNYHQSSAASTSKLDQLEILKKEPIFITEDSNKENYLKEIDSLRDKLMKYKSLDITNKSSIEFYENELQKIKSQNDKLNRKLDETLVTLNHCTELSTSTEVEYLRNVLYNYMLGKESLILARVIAAVCKFDPHQTETVLQKEQQKQTLLGQLGLI